MDSYAHLHVAIVCLSNDAFAPPGVGWIGGGQLGAYENGRHLVGQGARVTYILRQTECDQPIRQVLGPRCTVLRVPDSAPRSGKPREQGGAVVEMTDAGLKLLQREKALPNIVHSQYWIGGNLGQAISDELSIRHVHFFLSLGRLTNIHGERMYPDQKIRDKIEVSIYSKADCLVAQSVFVADKFKVLYPELSHDRVSVIHHGVDHNLFTPRPESAGDYLRRSASRFS